MTPPERSLRRRVTVASGIGMLAASVLGVSLRPSRLLAAERPVRPLSDVIPNQFGNWRTDPGASVRIVENPQQLATLRRIYSDILTRSYLDASGSRLMLSVAYGLEQAGDMQLHRPEICYPAQGFQIDAAASDSVNTPFGDIAVRRLVATQPARHEPITYWIRVGERTVVSGIDMRVAQLRYGLRGYIPDGLLVRVSSISADPVAAYGLQDDFIRQMLASVPEADRRRFVGRA